MGVKIVETALKEIKGKMQDKSMKLKYAVALSKYKEFDSFLSVLESRAKSATKDIEYNILDKILEKSMDIITGIKTADNPVITKIYISKLEEKYIVYLKEMLSCAYNIISFNSAVDQEKVEPRMA